MRLSVIIFEVNQLYRAIDRSRKCFREHVAGGKECFERKWANSSSLFSANFQGEDFISGKMRTEKCRALD